ncbi:hypothetical protein [Ammoniphilus sp. CFH 90114]|uniref:hypothetical protein n=1 Tax=Ammoniphilus sp. CFH 90114 TaxID=2493665 RepID=UPI00100F020B|nr:hypothetical protein [Ammoniphilus sp. CFH 90114]RXT04569.1 hypothetical protein EIZ39_20360 [Ammoniphilus sp. CFH 90114]
MFVRWKSKKAIDDRLRYVQLVRTTWETGKPRQKVVKHLGSIRESNMGDKRSQQEFWYKVKRNLRELGLAQGQKEQFEEKISETVPY